MNEVSEGKSLTAYLGNPFVLIGIGALVYWYFSRKKLLKNNPSINPSIRFIDGDNSNFLGNAQSKAKKHNVPLQLVQDVEKMDKKQVAKMILSNQDMINKTKMPNDERHQILNMVTYLEFELDNKE
jgi:hypothetical protein